MQRLWSIKMKNINPPLLLLSALIGSAIASSVHADDVDLTWEVNSGVKHDNTLTIAELDQVSQQSDVALTLQAQAKVKWQIPPKLTLKSTASYQINDYQKYSNYDLNIAKIAFDLDYRLADSTIGTSYYFVDAKLDKADFLQFSQNSLYWSKLYQQRYLLRFSADVKEKEFANLTERDASSFSVSNQHFYFFNQAKSFVSLNLTADNENAKDNQFDLRGFGVRALYSHSFVGWQHEQQLQLGWQYNKRDYQQAGTEEQPQRKDNSQVVDATWLFNLTPNWSINTKVEYGNYQSTLENLNYDETITSLSLKGTF